MTAPTIFQQLGLSVLALENGVYHLRRQAAQGRADEAVGLLFVAGPLNAESTQAKLFLQDVVPEATAARIVYHWQTLDARRLEESGLVPLVIDLTPEHIPAVVLEARCMRPDGARIRHTAKLATGEVVCYN